MSTIVPVKAEFARTSHVRSMDEYRALYKQSIEEPEAFWAEQAKLVHWFYPPQSILDADMEEVDFAWYSGGRLNACFNAVDRHAAVRPNKTAIVFTGNTPGEYRNISYRELKHNVARMANVLRSHGVRKGDRVCIYLPMIPELAFTVLACARIGAVHSVIFGGFSADSLRDRILDAGAKVLVTANEGPRGAKAVALKSIADHAIEGLNQVETVLVARRTPTDVPMKQGRDLWLDD